MSRLRCWGMCVWWETKLEGAVVFVRCTPVRAQAFVRAWALLKYHDVFVQVLGYVPKLVAARATDFIIAKDEESEKDKESESEVQFSNASAQEMTFTENPQFQTLNPRSCMRFYAITYQCIQISRCSLQWHNPSKTRKWLDWPISPHLLDILRSRARAQLQAKLL
jgi:hypothetical protein